MQRYRDRLRGASATDRASRERDVVVDGAQRTLNVGLVPFVLELWYDDVPVGRGHIAHTTPVTNGVEPFSIGEQRMTPVAPALDGQARLPAGVLEHVIMEALGPTYPDPEVEQRAALPIQLQRRDRRATPRVARTLDVFGSYAHQPASIGSGRMLGGRAM